MSNRTVPPTAGIATQDLGEQALLTDVAFFHIKFIPLKYISIPFNHLHFVILKNELCYKPVQDFQALEKNKRALQRPL